MPEAIERRRQMAEVVNALDRVSVVLVRCDEAHRALHLVEDRPFWPLTETVLSARDIARRMLADMRSAAQSTGEDGPAGRTRALGHEPGA